MSRSRTTPTIRRALAIYKRVEAAGERTAEALYATPGGRFTGHRRAPAP
jgi:hypothetical protein